MKFNPKAKIESIVSKDETRHNLCQPWLDLSQEGDPRLIATNGHGLVALPVLVTPEDVEGPVPLEAIKMARKNFDKNGKAPHISVPQYLNSALADKAEVALAREEKKTQDDLLTKMPWAFQAFDIVCSKEQVSVGPVSWRRNPETRFPDWREIVPRVWDPNCKLESAAYNPYLLIQVLEAMGVEKLAPGTPVHMKGTDDLGPLKVCPQSFDSVIGVLMPMRT